MSKKTKNPARVRPLGGIIRPGEGYVLDVVHRERPRPDGTTVSSIGVELGSAPVPERRYVCDVASVNRGEQGVQLLFAQAKVGSSALRSLLVVHVSGGGVGQFLRAMEEMGPRMRSYLQRTQPHLRERLIDLPEEPQQTVALAANLIVASHSGQEACLDFYHASAFSFHAVKLGGNLAVDPVVRVFLTTSLFDAIYAKLEELKSSMPEEESE